MFNGLLFLKYIRNLFKIDNYIVYIFVIYQLLCLCRVLSKENSNNYARYYINMLEDLWMEISGVAKFYTFL